MATIQEYFTDEERAQLPRLIKGLSDRLGSQLSSRDVDTVHDLILQGITQAGIFKRDQYGLNQALEDGAHLV